MNHANLISTVLVVQQVCGYPERRTCAVIDAHYVVHLDKRTASAQFYHNLTYEDVRMMPLYVHQSKLEERVHVF